MVTQRRHRQRRHHADKRHHKKGHPAYKHMIRQVLSGRKHRGGCTADAIVHLCTKKYGHASGGSPKHMSRHIHKQLRMLFKKGKLMQKGHHYLLAKSFGRRRRHKRRKQRHRRSRKRRKRHD